MNFRKLGKQGPTISAIGLGCMGMSEFYGTTDEEQSIRTIHQALDWGINFLDTADMYGMGHNEELSQIERVAPLGAARGLRYPEEAMKAVNH